MSFSRPALILGAFTFLPVANDAYSAERPNVVLVMTDDQGIGDFGATGNKVIETPNIDALSKRSASMKTFYVSPVCSPNRAAFTKSSLLVVESHIILADNLSPVAAFFFVEFDDP